MSSLKIEVITPEHAIFVGKGTAIMLPGTEGLFQILPQHAPMISTMGAGEVKITKASQESKFKEEHEEAEADGESHWFYARGGDVFIQVEGGVVEVMKNKVIVLAERVISVEEQKQRTAQTETTA
jgi:F-type H+-transporting ATPase subunit epsilon